VTLWRWNGEERASDTPKAPTKVEVVGQLAQRREKGGKATDMQNVINALLQW
jgi:hypothetical protein